jgi:hypothetical protein
MHLSLISEDAAVDMGGHTLLDESLIFFGSELSVPPSHGKNNMPFLLAGGDGKTVRTGAGSSAAACRTTSCSPRS